MIAREMFDGHRRIVACIQRMSGFYNRPGRTLRTFVLASHDEKASTFSSVFEVVIYVGLFGLKEPGKLFPEECTDRVFLALMLQQFGTRGSEEAIHGTHAMSQNVSKCPRFEDHANQLRSAINMIMRSLCPIPENRIGSIARAPTRRPAAFCARKAL